MSLANEGAHLSPPARAVPVRARLARAGVYFALTKPRVMSLVVFTGAVGLLIAPGRIDPVRALAVLLCIAIGAGAAAALNMWYDAGIDGLMRRTAARPLPRGMISPRAALAFGLTMAVVSVAGLAVVANVVAAALLAFTIFFYIAVYTVWLKRSTPQSIVIGGAAGAAPPAIAWLAAAGKLGIEPLFLFLLIFFWTPPHFWALALNRAGEYARAGIPVLPAVSGEAETRRQILIYTFLLLPISLLPCLFGLAGGFYAGVAIASGVVMIALSVRLRCSGEPLPKAANLLFGFSICYLVFVFGALLLERILGH
jgi:protoheme IX farnesyltransferase